MYPTYQQPDPLRLILAGFCLGFAFAALLFFKMMPESFGFAAEKPKVQQRTEAAPPASKTPLPTAPPATRTQTESSTTVPKENTFSNESPYTNNRTELNAVQFDAIITVENINLREDGSIYGRSIRKLHRGEKVQVIEESIDFDELSPRNDGLMVRAKWYKVFTEQGQDTGWVFGWGIRGINN